VMLAQPLRPDLLSLWLRNFRFASLLSLFLYIRPKADAYISSLFLSRYLRKSDERPGYSSEIGNDKRASSEGWHDQWEQVPPG
jgi:hypothetical protein